MSYSNSFTIVIENQSNYTFQFSYNSDTTTFQDLLEYVSLNYPQYNICPCFKVQYYDNSSNYYDLNMNEKLYQWRNNNSYSQYKLINKNSDKKCVCSETKKKDFIKTKLDLINSIEKINHETYLLQDQKSFMELEVESLKNEKEKLIKENQTLNSKIRELENDLSKNQKETEKLKSEKEKFNLEKDIEINNLKKNMKKQLIN